MSVKSEIDFICPKCGHVSKASVYSRIDVVAEPELKALVKDGSLFVHECPECSFKKLVAAPLLYLDHDAKLLICLSEQFIKADSLPEGYTARQVGDVGSLIEKVKIFDDGLDDVAMEMCKYVTSREMELEADFKYLGCGGRDNEITLTYPKDGQMQMVELGFNVYQDCLAIVNRNNVFKEKSAGLARVDADLISKIIR